MGTIFDRTAAHIQRNALVIVATLLLAISTVSSTAFAESALSDSADAASRYDPKTYAMRVVGTVTVTVTESAPEPTPKPEPTPEPATSADAVPAPSPASQASPSSKQVKATTSTASGKAVLPKTGDTAAPFAGAACLAAAAGVCLLLARRLRR